MGNVEEAIKQAGKKRGTWLVAEGKMGYWYFLFLIFHVSVSVFTFSPLLWGIHSFSFRSSIVVEYKDMKIRGK